MAKKPKDVHVDLLEIDMTTGAYWLSPAQKHQDSARAKEIRDKHRQQWLAKKRDKKRAKKA